MKNRISVIIAASNDQEVIEEALKSVVWADEIIVVLSENSTDKTYSIAKQFTSKIYKTINHLGHQRQYGVRYAIGNWILILDTDEKISSYLQDEITIRLLNRNGTKPCDGYYIPYKNYFFGRLTKWGNQNYSKLRLFKKNKGKIEYLKTHPEIHVNGEVGQLNYSIIHYSFRSIRQVINKFNYYAIEDIPTLIEKETPSLLKLATYPLHMVYSLFIKEKGYKDGIWGLGLALCFAYYEFMRYWFLWMYQMKKRWGLSTS